MGTRVTITLSMRWLWLCSTTIFVMDHAREHSSGETSQSLLGFAQRRSKKYTSVHHRCRAPILRAVEDGRDGALTKSE